MTETAMGRCRKWRIDMLKVALIGYGYWGPNVAKQLYRNKNYIFKTICDLRPDRLEKARELYADSIGYTGDYTMVLRDPEIDLVAIAVETSAHYKLAKEALRSGKHIYVEKPFTDNVAQAEELKKLALERKLYIHVDHIMVYHPAVRKIKEIIENGDLGDILYVSCYRQNLGNVKNDVSAMWDLSVHDLSVIDYLTNGAKVRFVKALGEKVYSSRESVTFLSVQYDSFIANITANWISPIKERKMIIAGTRKMLVYDDVDVINKLIVYDKGFDRTPIKDMEYDEFVVKSRIGDAVIPKLEQSDALFNSLDHIRNCIEKGEESLTNADAAIRVIKILELADKDLLEADETVQGHEEER
jgi:predicted dehydrogenase